MELRDRRRMQILEAAAKIFRQKGFHATRTEEICEAADLSAGTVFRYFSSKDDIIAAIAEMEHQRNREDLRQLGTKEGLKWLASMTPEQFGELMAPSLFDLGMDSWLELYRNQTHQERVQKEDEDLREQLRKALRQGQTEGWVRPDLSVEGAVHAVFALFIGLATEKQLTPRWNRDATAQVVASFFRRCILADRQEG